MLKKILVAGLALALAVGPVSVFAESSDAEVRNVVYLVNGNLGDKSFFDSAKAGLDKLAADGRIKLKTVEMGGTDADQPKWLSTLYEVADSGEYDLVICGMRTAMSSILYSSRMTWDISSGHSLPT